MRSIPSNHWTLVAVAIAAITMLLALPASSPAAEAAAGDCTTDCFVSPLGDDSNSGQTVVNAFRTLQKAVDTVQDGGTIHVEPGLYDANFTNVTKSVTFLGAQAGEDPTDQNSPRIPGDVATESVIKSNTGLRVQGVDSSVTIDGFSFQEKAAGQSFAITTGIGGGDVSASLLIKNNIIDMNTSSGIGSTSGTNASSLDINHNRFIAGNVNISAVGDADATLTVSQNTFEAQSTTLLNATSWIGMQFTGNSSISSGTNFPLVSVGGCLNCSIAGNSFLSPAGTSVINVFAANGVKSPNTTVTGNSISGPITANNDAIFIGQADGVLVSGNTITGARRTGITIDSSASGTQVSGNTITGAGSTGILANTEAFLPTGTGRTIHSNTVTGTGQGIHLDEPALVTGNSVSASTLAAIRVEGNGASPSTHINLNSITGNTFGVQNFATAPIDATCNWWGDAGGPGGAAGGPGDTVSEHVAFAPWLFAAPPTDPCHVDVFLCNGVVDGQDVLAILNTIVGLTAAPQPTSPCTADVNFDDTVDLRDAVAMQRFIAGLPVN